MASNYPTSYGPTYSSTAPPYPTTDAPFTTRYVPDNYLTPSAPRKKRVTFEPPRPEQYRPPQDTRGVPPAQLPLDYQDPRFTNAENYDHNHDRRPRSHQRHESADSRHSARSHASAHHRHDRRRDSDHERDRSGHRHHHHHHEYRSRSRSSDPDPADNYKLKRKDTPRGYGSSLFALFGGIKRYARGG